MGEKLSDSRKDLSQEISLEEVRTFLENGPVDHGIRLVDTREDGELVVGYIDRAMLVPNSILMMVIEDLLPDKNVSIILYCASGVRSLRAAALMKEMGYRDVRSMAGGFNAWVEAGYGIKTRGTMTMDQVNRYSRQMLLSEVGEEGQLKLLQSRVLIVGAGGLGSPVALYLAAAGVGTLGIYDFDVVDLSNIHRQPLHFSADVGMPKTESAKETLRRINPHISIATHQERFTAENALKTIAAYDIVVDGSDNFATKFLLNDAAFFAKKPFVFGGAVRFDGQASVFSPHDGGPCLRCMMPEIPPPGTSPS